MKEPGRKEGALTSSQKDLSDDHSWHETQKAIVEISRHGYKDNVDQICQAASQNEETLVSLQPSGEHSFSPTVETHQ